jgi:hypothetical protein
VPPEYFESRLYHESLGAQGEHHREPRDRLRLAHERMRARVAPMAAQIALDLPGFTVHDEEGHLDALWVLADTIAGPDAHFNAAEGFLFGAAVLLHDLGLAVAAYPGGVEELRGCVLWRDAAGVELRRGLGRAPTPAEMGALPDEVVEAADQHVLRERHAARAVDLATIHWGPADDPVFLLEDSGLRRVFGHRAGQLAASHWWSVSELRQLRNDTLAVAELPGDWPVDVLKLACLLRLADIAHLDSRRAPALRRALQMPTGHSKLHWDFQELLARPVVHGQELRFNSIAPFGPDRADAWWLCADALAAVDRELADVASLLEDVGREPMAVRGVIGVRDPERLRETIATEGWEPVDARVRISDVPGLVHRLGGQQLYGDDPVVPLREAIQNATDAVRARAEAEPDPPAAAVRAEFEETDDPDWMTVHVTDNGVGMSREVLTGSLLDFGISLWRDREVMHHIPGLAASSFEPTGRFGIGFFALFMYGRPVRVISRFHLAGAHDTYMLEFPNGLEQRAMVRRAEGDERFFDAGTRVTFQVPAAAFGEHDQDDGTPATLAVRAARLLEVLCPALDVDLSLRVGAEDQRIVRAGDWVDLPPAELLGRVAQDSHRDITKAMIDRVRPVRSADGTIVGRMVAAGGSLFIGPAPCVLTVGGLSAMRSREAVGLLLGEEPNVARSQAHVRATRAELADWATEQGQLWVGAGLTVSGAINVAALIASWGGDVGQLPICFGAKGALDRDALVAWAAERDEIVLWEKIDDDDLPRVGGWTTPTFRPATDTIVIDASVYSDTPFAHAPDDPSRRTESYLLVDLVLDAISRAWARGVSIGEASLADTQVIGSTEEVDEDVWSTSALLFERHPD